MTTTTIPEQKVVTCDGCNREISSKVKCGGDLAIYSIGYDLHGQAVGGHRIKKDFCQRCMHTLEKTLNDKSLWT